MKTSPTFIISFDCEGKWGMADHLTSALAAQLTDKAIEGAYEKILSILTRHGIVGTFAFVGAFTLSVDEFFACESWLSAGGPRINAWLAALRRDLAAGAFEGWFVPSVRERVIEAGPHEIATHGFTHVPFGTEAADEAEFIREMEMVCRVSNRQGWVPRTIIYPRNQIGYVEKLAAFGIRGYREKLSRGSRSTLHKLQDMAREYGIVPRCQEHAVERQGPIGIPSGYILNFWHNVPRRLVPRATTHRRWSGMLDHAITTGGVVHLWSHPHNFVSDPGLFDVLDHILNEVSVRVRSGRMTNVTQAEYCR